MNLYNATQTYSDTDKHTQAYNKHVQTQTHIYLCTKVITQTLKT